MPTDPLLSVLTDLRGRLDAGLFDDTSARHVDAAFVLVIDLIATADGAVMREGWNAAKHMRDRLLIDGADREGAAYMAGRLDALATLLGQAAMRCSPPDFRAAMVDPRYGAVLAALRADPRPRAADAVAAAAGLDLAGAQERLAELRALGAVATTTLGEARSFRLTPSAQNFLDSQPTAPGRSHGEEAVDDLLRALNSMAQDDATGEIVALVREDGRLVQRAIDLGERLDRAAILDALAAARCELLVIDGGNAHGDAWKAVFHPVSRTMTVVPEDAPAAAPWAPAPR